MPIQGDLKKAKTIDMTDKNVVKASHTWWLDDDDKLYKSVHAVCDDILLNLSVRRRMNWFFANIYNDTGSAGMAGAKFTNLYYNKTAMDGNAALNGSLTLNATQSAIDTAASMISKNKPKPQFVTDGEVDYNVKVRGKKLTKYVEGVFDQLKAYSVMQKMFVDACIFGTGAVKVFIQDDKIKAENIFIEELLIDDLEGMHEKPRQIHQRKYLPREMLKAQFPKYKDKLDSVSTVSGGAATFSTADVIPVIESWHLPSGKKTKDGKHSICVENCTLFSEEYTKDYYPIIFFRWAHQTLGFWGRGIIHEVWKLQRELDMLLQTMQAVYRRVSGPIIAVESGSNIAESHLTSNKLVKIIEYSQVEPKYMIPPMIQEEMYNQRDYLEQRIYTISGVAQTQAQGETPDQLKSAPAIRENNDVASGRFEVVAQRYEAAHLELADLIVDLSSELDKPTVLVTGKGGAQSLDFRDCKVDREEYKLQLFPISGLPSTPAGRLDQLMDYAQAGYLTKEQVMDIVDFPDLEDTITLETAALHLTQQILSNIKEDGKAGYVSPGMYLDLPTAFRMALLEVDRATLQHVDPANIDLLRRWAMQCKDLMDQTLPPPAPQQNAGTPSQQGAPSVGAAQVAPQPSPTAGAPPAGTPPQG